ETSTLTRMADHEHYRLDDYVNSKDGPPVFCLTARAQFSPLDINIAFLIQSGWNQAVDRLRFHTASPLGASDHPLASANNQRVSCLTLSLQDAKRSMWNGRINGSRRKRILKWRNWLSTPEVQCLCEPSVLWR